MSQATPTLMNLPPPPSDPTTPSELPGTPNSATTTMSELSTVALKDGHRGHFAHNSHTSAQPDAERADRISRLAGLGRVATARNAAAATPGMPAPPYAQGMTATAASGTSGSYFDPTTAAGLPGASLLRERSTVGSASATNSMGARTTWASVSDGFDPDNNTDRTSDTVSSVNIGTVSDQMDTSSIGGMSDEGTNSLVAFGEGARTPARHSAAFTAATMVVQPGPAHLQAGSALMSPNPAKIGATPTSTPIKPSSSMSMGRNMATTSASASAGYNRGLAADNDGDTIMTPISNATQIENYDPSMRVIDNTDDPLQHSVSGANANANGITPTDGIASRTRHKSAGLGASNH